MTTSKTGTIAMYKMTSYDPVQQVAGFTFIDSSNNLKTILLSRMLFSELMGEKQWNQKRFGQMSSQQFSFKSCLKDNSKGITNWADWFDRESNNIIKETMSRPGRKS